MSHDHFHVSSRADIIDWYSSGPDDKLSQSPRVGDGGGACFTSDAPASGGKATRAIALPGTGAGTDHAGALRPPLRPGRLNPFSFHVAADAQALKTMSHNSYARRRWLHVNQISEQAESAPVGHIEGEITAAVYSNSSVLQQLEHQWTSLSEPAVLPLTTDTTSEHMQAKQDTVATSWRDLVAASTTFCPICTQGNLAVSSRALQVMQTHRSAEASWWRLDVPRQEEVARPVTDIGARFLLTVRSCRVLLGSSRESRIVTR